MNFLKNRKSLMKLGMWSLVILSLVLFGFFVVNFILLSFADVDPGALQGYNFCGGGPCPTWVNLTRGDMFFANGNDVYIIANISCSAESNCNGSATVDANFSQIGGNQLRRGIFKQNGTDGRWAIFEFNDTVNSTGTLSSITQIQPKNITMNATIANDTSGEYGTYDLPSFVATVLLVNMSTFGCPPADQQGAAFPTVPGYNITTGQRVSTPTQAQGCTQNSTLCAYTDSYGPGTWDDVNNSWKVCAPTFGGATTNMTAIAATGNFSTISNFTIEVPGKAKLVFLQNVSFANQQESQAIMEFAMKSAMTGGRIGINDTHFNGQGNRPNLNLSARLTIYNISQYGITGRPQLIRTGYDGSNPQTCPTAICQDIVWDGENLTFTVTSFSSYQATDAINVTLNTPGDNTWWPTTRNVNFTYTPVWNDSVTMDNCTLWGNFTGEWAANATNSTRSLANDSINWINNTVGTDGVYSWNVECYDILSFGDSGNSNYTVKVDATSPTITVISPANTSYFNTTSKLFEVVLTEANKNNTINVTVYYRRINVGNYQSQTLTCYGSSPYTCNKTIDLSSLVEHGNVLQYLFNTTDLAGNTGENGTGASPLTITLDLTAPSSPGSVTHTDDAPSGYDNDTTLVFNWTAATDGTSGINQYKIYLSTDGGAYTYDGTNNTALGYSFTGSDGSTYAINVTSVDNAGNENTTGTVSSTITVDTTEPSVTAAWVNDTVLRTTAGLNVNVNVTDTNRDASNVKVSGDSGTTLVTMSQVGSSDNFTADTTPALLGCGVDAACTLTFYVTDLAGNLNNTETTSVTTDNTNPASLSFVSPTENNNANKSQNFYYVNVTFTEANPDQCFVDDGSTNTSMTRSGTAFCYKNMTSQSDGTYNYRVWMNDTAGNVGNSSTRIVNLDTVSPIVTANPTTYAAGKSKATNGDTVTLNATVTDASPATGINTVTVDASGLGCAADLALTHQGSGIYTATCQLTGATSGTKSLTVTATDYASNSNNTVSLTVEVDVTAPTIDLSYPSNNAYLRGSSFNINGTASDTSAASVVTNDTHFTTNSGSYASWNFVNTSELTDGSYVVLITANDTAGNSNSTIANFTVDNTNPTITNVVPVSGGYFNDPSTRLFQVTLTETNKNNTINVTVYYRRINVGNYQSQNLTCYGSSPYTCNKTIDLSSLIGHGEVLQYLFNTTDLAGNTGENGTGASPLTATVDTAAPTYANNNTNSTTIGVGGAVLIYTQWSDTYVLRYATLATNETGAWQNKTANYSSPATLSGTSAWSNFTWSNSSITTGTRVEWRIYANDSAGNENVTSIGAFTIDSTAPTWSDLDQNVTNDTTITKGTIAEVRAKWADNVNLGYYWLSSNETGSWANGTASSLTEWSNTTIDTSGAEFGLGELFQVKIYANDTSGNENVTDLWQWTIDGGEPEYDNESTTPTTPIQYAPGKSYTFNISWSDNVAISKVIFEANFTNAPTLSNYTDATNPPVVSLGSNNYSITFTDLSANHSYNYTYRWFANDTSNNWNNTDYYNYNVSKNETNPVNIYIYNGTVYTNDNVTITYGASITANATRVYPNSGEAKLYRGESLITGANETVTLAANTAGYAYKANVTGNANYTDNSTGITYYLFVNNATLQGSISGDSVTYPTAVSVTPSESNTGDGDVNYTFWRNDTLVSSAINSAISADTTQLAAGVYHYVLNSTGGANYSENASIATLDVTVNPGTLSLAITGGASQVYPYQSTITGTESNTGDGDVTYELWRDTTMVDNTSAWSETATLGVADYTYRFNATIGTNWTANSTGVTTALTISINTSTSDYMNLTLGVGTTGSETALTVEYPNTTNATGWYNSNAFVGPAPSFALYRNGGAVGSDTDNVELGAGTYVYVYNTSVNTNYTTANKSFTLTVSQNSSNPVDLYFRNSTEEYKNQNMVVTYGTATNATAAMVYSGRGSAELFRNTSNVTDESGTNVTLAAAVYEYRANTTGNANYTENITGSTYYLTVNRATSTCSLTFNATSSIVYGTALNVTCTCTNPEGTANLYRDNSNVSGTENNTGIILGAATYSYVCNVTQTTNYTNASNSSTFTITAASTSITLYLNGTSWSLPSTKVYPNATNVNATINVSALQSSVVLYRNETSASGYSQEILLGVGVYNYTGYFAGNTNYTTSQTTQILTIGQGTPILTLTASPSWTPSDVTAATVTCSATSQNSEVTANLYKNGTNVNTLENGIAVMRASGAYNFTCNSTAGGNYTSNSTSNIMTVTGTKGSIEGYIFLRNSTTVPSGTVNAYISGTGNSRGIEPSGYFKFENLNPATYTVSVSGAGYYGNSTSVSVTAGGTANANMTILGPENYNFTLPDQSTHSFWTSGWHNFWLSTRPFTSVTNYNFTSLFSSINGNYTAIYRNVSGTWQSFIRSESSNDFYNISTSDYLYWIYMNATDRVEVEPKYIIVEEIL